MNITSYVPLLQLMQAVCIKKVLLKPRVLVYYTNSICYQPYVESASDVRIQTARRVPCRFQIGGAA